MIDYVQISAQISEATRDRLDLYARETGMKKSRLVEDAILAHLDTLDAVPSEYVIPASIVLDAVTWDAVLADIERPAEPTAALRELMLRSRDAG
ncbi:MAG: hypothetical protein Q8S43_01105 [Actinomycetota bacterium]|nr:MAG: hypothetical protein FD171_143 [Actinomycetota bacterium]MDO8950604.1 hypothetical protein [Actinomycetota bacterium]MDP3629538.1 hypothetical protein [Actinomycetota bacterium]